MGDVSCLLFSSEIITVITDILAEWDMDIYTSRIHILIIILFVEI
jgi:hypothetical protein